MCIRDRHLFVLGGAVEAGDGDRAEIRADLGVVAKLVHVAPQKEARALGRLAEAAADGEDVYKRQTPESAPGAGNGSGYEILVRSRFVDYPRIYEQDAELYRVVGGLRGDVTPDIHWEMAANIDRYTLNFTLSLIHI